MSEIPTITPSPQREAPDPGSVHSYWCLIAYHVLAAMWGIRNIYHTEPSGLDLLIPIAFAICLGLWAVVDARWRRYRIPMLAKPWFFLLAGIVVPGYVIWSRGWRGLGLVALHAVLWYLLAILAMHVGGIILYGEAWLEALGM